MSFLGLGPIIRLSSSNWLITWVGIEISLIGLIPLSIRLFEVSVREPLIKYFIIQRMARSIILFFGLLVFSLQNIRDSIVLLLSLSIIIKLGFFPLHFWVIPVVSGLSFYQNIIILGPQKIVPLRLIINIFTLSRVEGLSILVLILSRLSIIWGSLVSNNTTEIKIIIGGSSITHTGWIGFGLIYGGIWVYFFIYFIVTLILLYCLNEVDFLLRSFLLLSLSGLPPFVLFSGKFWILWRTFNLSRSFIVLLIPILSAVVSLNFYLKFRYFFILFYGKIKPFSNKAVILCTVFVNFFGVFLFLIL